MPVLLISGLVAGWFVFQGWLAGDLRVGLYGGKSFNAGVGNGTLPGILDTTSFWAGLFFAMKYENTVELRTSTN